MTAFLSSITTQWWLRRLWDWGGQLSGWLGGLLALYGLMPADMQHTLAHPEFFLRPAPETPARSCRGLRALGAPSKNPSAPRRAPSARRCLRRLSRLL